MSNRERECIRPLTQNREEKQPTGKDIIDIISQELADIRILFVKRTNRMMIEAAVNSQDFEEIKGLLVQTLCNISDDEHPMYHPETDRLSHTAMRLFYNMPATVLSMFDVGERSALRGLQCRPDANRPLTKQEFLLWQLTKRDVLPTAQDKIDYLNEQLALYGYAPLRDDDPTDYLTITLLSSAQNSSTLPTARKQICKILHAENEISADRTRASDDKRNR